MTTACWDGKTLAADKQVTMGSLPMTTTKIFKIKGSLLAFAGTLGKVMELVNWFENFGADPTLYPKFQEDDEERCSMREVTPNGTIYAYEYSGHPYIIEDTQFSIGSGRDFAITAMYLGVTAEQAVTVAAKFDCYTGMGIDTLMLDKDEAPWEL
jgi:ATP-dependent protease HslVU (ClpYQ) peptidase subunit